MTTRRFTEEFPDPDYDESEEQYDQPLPSAADEVPTQPRGNLRSGKRSNAHMPRTLTQVMNDANDRVVRGDLVDYVPMPTGFDPLDGFIGGGLRKTELLLLGGAQGIGKTIATLQIARNIAMR